MSTPRAVVTDIEGTTTPISFVHDVLFPYARAHLPALVRERAEEPAFAEALAEVRRLAPGREPLAALLGWMDEDAKITPLKALQGLLWRDGYAAGELKAQLYPDVAPVLRAWHQAGVALYVYSSGSEEAQRLIFGYSGDGDLGGLFTGFFDTTIGAKREASSYRAILARTGQQGGDVLFLSDNEAELDAALVSGLRTCQLARAEDGTAPSKRHPHADSFPKVARLFGLPEGQ